jgi:adenine-specific DNA-methyltransferase
MEFFPQGGFDTPKPSRLIKQILKIGTSSGANDIVLDFFAGSGTTAQSVLQINHEDGGNRQFICVQLPEPIGISEYSTIAEITKERTRRVISRVKQEAKNELDLQDRDTPEDLGFRVYKLGRSNYKAWQDYQGESVEELETFFDRIETPLVDGWQREHVLAEAMLLQGFPLDSTVTGEQGFRRNRIQRVESDAVGHRLFVCLDDQIADETIAQIQLAAEDVFICLDSALTDEAKLRLGDRCTLRVI